MTHIWVHHALQSDERYFRREVASDETEVQGELFGFGFEFAV